MKLELGGPQSRALLVRVGAYISSFSPQHWAFLQNVVQQTGYPVVAPDYSLAPQHTAST